MNTNDKTQLYIKLKSIVRISGYGNIDTYKDFQKGTGEKIYKRSGGIEQFFIDELNLNNKNDLEIFTNNPKVTDKINQINILFTNQFSSNKARRTGFGTFEKFYTWYLKQGNTCHYCEIEQKKLSELFESTKITSTKFNATLHIERIIPKKPYSPNNCYLACSLCNNAKSDLISEKNFKLYFAPGIKKFYKDLYAGKIVNNY